MFNTAYKRAKPQAGRGPENAKDELELMLSREVSFNWHRKVYDQRFNDDQRARMDRALGI